MKRDDFQDLVASIKEAGEIRAGRRSPSRVFEIRPPEIGAVRKKLRLTQTEFAQMILNPSVEDTDCTDCTD